MVRYRALAAAEGRICCVLDIVYGKNNIQLRKAEKNLTSS